jgi:hypothetical protein
MSKLLVEFKITRPLFWLEVGDDHKSTKGIEKITKERLKSAEKFCMRTGARLVYAQVSTKWMLEAVGWSIGNLSLEVAMVMGNKQKFGKLPIVEWEK